MQGTESTLLQIRDSHRSDMPQGPRQSYPKRSASRQLLAKRSVFEREYSQVAVETQSGVLTVTGFDPESNFKSGGDLRDRSRSSTLDGYLTLAAAAPLDKLEARAYF